MKQRHQSIQSLIQRLRDARHRVVDLRKGIDDITERIDRVERKTKKIRNEKPNIPSNPRIGALLDRIRTLLSFERRRMLKK